MDSSLFHPYDKPKFKAHVSKIDTVKSPSGKLAHDIFSLGNIYICILYIVYIIYYIYIIFIYIYTRKPCVSPLLKLSYVTFEICISFRRNTFVAIVTPKKMHFNLRPPMNLSTCILRGRRGVFAMVVKI